MGMLLNGMRPTASAAAVPAAAAPATTAPAAPAAPADDAAPAAAPAAVPAAATAHAHVMTSLPARSNPGSSRAKGAESAGTEDEGSELSVIASALHLALSDLKSGLAAGKSLAQIATSAGIDPNKLIATLVDDATNKINAAVSLGALSRAQADKIIARIPGLVSDVVNHAFGDIRAGLAPGSQLPESLGSLGKLASLGNFANLGSLANHAKFADLGDLQDLTSMEDHGDIGDFRSFFRNMFGSFGSLGKISAGLRYLYLFGRGADIQVRGANLIFNAIAKI